MDELLLLTVCLVDNVALGIHDTIVEYSVIVHLSSFKPQDLLIKNLLGNELHSKGFD